MWRSCCLAILCTSLLAGRLALAEGPASASEAVEADWLVQDKVRTLARAQAPRRSTVSTRSDARGGVDGVRDGKWGFHTENEPNPWWQVDLGSKEALDRVVLYNRCDPCGERNNRIILLLSDDGKTWQQAYQHNGTPFGGQPDGKPLAIGLEGKPARFVRLTVSGTSYFHLDEVEIYAAADPKKNIALGRPADQSSTSEWSVEHDQAAAPRPEVASYPLDVVLARGRKLADDLLAAGAPVEALAAKLDAIAQRAQAMPKDAPPEEQRSLYFEARWTVRRIAFANPLLDFDQLVFAKRVPGSYSHMSDQHYGWWSRPGGGLFILSGLKTAEPQIRCLTGDLGQGSLMSPDLSFDGTRILFAWCRHYPGLSGKGDKTDKKSIPDDAFYHVYEVGVDGTGLRQITRGRYDDFDPRYLPDGRIVFLSTRRGQAIQVGRASAQATLDDPFLPDSYVRCGGGNSRPVAVFTLHTTDPDGRSIRAISPFENFEWTPSIAPDGRILFARWDYVDRHNNAFMSLWATHPDGSNPVLVYGNFTRSPQSIFEARAIPGSDKLLFTASAHHAITAGSICLLDPSVGTEEAAPITRLTPEVCFPETEGWPATYYTSPFPLSERYYLVAWSPKPIHPEGGQNDTNCLGIYLADAFGNLELIHRDPAISSQFPIPLRPRQMPHAIPDLVEGDGAPARFLVLDVYRGLDGVPTGSVKSLRIIGCPAKTQPQMNQPNIGATAEDPGKFVLGTVPVEPDGSAHFLAPSGLAVFFQALDADGMAIQTMRTLTSVQPGQTVSCIGCHEQRSDAPPNLSAAAAAREPSLITPGPEGSWPLRFDHLVQPVLDRYCVRCHSPGGKPEALRKLDFTPARSFAALTAYGDLYGQIKQRYLAGRSPVGSGAARNSAFVAYLLKPERNPKLDRDSLDRIITWIDTYAQRQGYFSDDQERRLLDLRQRWAPLLAPR